MAGWWQILRYARWRQKCPISQTPLTQPPCQMRGLDISLLGAGENDCGIWECDPGRFKADETLRKVYVVLALPT